MTFVLQKILWFLVLPPASPAALILLGLVLIDRRRRTGKALVLTGLALLYLLSLGHTADVLVKPLEQASSPITMDRTPVGADAVVVLGGGSIDLAWLGADATPNAETSSRLITGVVLARKLGVPLVLSMGNGEPFATAVNDADVMADTAAALGMPRNRIVVENRSRNTVENAHAVRKLIAGNTIVLVTSAYHMKRAKTMFAKRGFSVLAAPAYFLGQSRRCSPVSLIPRAGDLAHSSTAIAEWASLVWWSIRGEM